MQPLDVTWGRVLSVFWLFIWRALVGAIVLGAAAGFVIGFGGVMLGADRAALGLTSTVVGAVIGLVWSLVVVRMMLRKRYRTFRIVLVAA